MKTICSMNLKGGVGKTTTVFYTGSILAAKAKKRVLMLDADPQCNLSEFFGANPDYGNLADILRQERGYHACLQHTSIPGLDIIPAGDALMELDLSAVEGKQCSILAIREMVEDIAALDLYDYILVDCPPAFNAAAAAALIAADEVIIPIKLDAFSLRGMANITRQIRNMQKINPKLRVAGFLPTMWYRSSKIQEAEQLLRSSGLRVLPHIRRSPKVDEITFDGDALASRNSASSVDYRYFVAEFFGGECNGL